jgi:hypothetical protein
MAPANATPYLRTVNSLSSSGGTMRQAAYQGGGIGGLPQITRLRLSLDDAGAGSACNDACEVARRRRTTKAQTKSQNEGARREGAQRKRGSDGNRAREGSRVR